MSDAINWRCCCCGKEAYFDRKKDNDKIEEGTCYDCRNKAFGFDYPRNRPNHTEMKDRKILK